MRWISRLNYTEEEELARLNRIKATKARNHTLPSKSQVNNERYVDYRSQVDEFNKNIPKTSMIMYRKDGGLIYVKRKDKAVEFIWGMTSSKWRVKGKGQWYWGKSFKHFITTYVYGEN